MASNDENKKPVSSKNSQRSFIFLGVGIAAGIVIALVIVNSQTQDQVFPRIVDESSGNIAI